MLRAWSLKLTFATSLFSRRASFFSSSVVMINPYAEYHGAYGGGADDRVEQGGGTGGSSVHPWGSVNLIDELLVALMPPRRRVSFLLGGAVSSILRGDSETDCLLEDVVDDGLDDDDPFLVKRLVVFFHIFAALSSLIQSWGFQPVIRHTKFISEYGF
jgi:hypothetical protein